jgi:predicted ATP-grasp superfamily ATP-dependent carboligase
MVPAVVIGLGLNGLGVVRSLARAGVPVIAIDDTPGNPAMRTRYGRKAWVRALEGDALVEDLVTLAQSLPEQPVLFLTGEAAVHTVSTQRAMLEPYYRMRLPAPEVVDSLMHKDTFQDLAETHGFRVPRRVHVVDDANLDGARALRYPVILKPGRRDSSYARHFKKAYRVENFEALVKLCRWIMPTLADLIVQEWIQGPDSNVYFCLQ